MQNNESAAGPSAQRADSPVSLGYSIPRIILEQKENFRTNGSAKRLAAEGFAISFFFIVAAKDIGRRTAWTPLWASCCAPSCLSDA
jgi:hypothetical protein